MPQLPLKYSAILTVATSLLAGVSTGCREYGFSQFGVNPESTPSPQTEVVAPITTQSPASVPPSPAPTAPEASAIDRYQQAIDQASSAFTLSQSAQSNDDWKLAARRWQQAIELMASVPKSDPHYAQAQRKVAEYRNNLTVAQQQSTRATTALYPDGRIVVRPQPSPSPRVAAAPTPMTTAARPPAATPAAPASNTGNSGPTGQQVFYAPIVRREGNTPVIRVTFNGNQPFDMIVDTGASGTLITQSMAQSLNVRPVSTAMVNTASQRGVAIPLGYVNSIEVNGAVSSNVLVAIAGPELRTGLLGHDFFGQYDVTVRQNQVEFRVR